MRVRIETTINRTIDVYHATGICCCLRGVSRISQLVGPVKATGYGVIIRRCTSQRDTGTRQTRFTARLHFRKLQMILGLSLALSLSLSLSLFLSSLSIRSFYSSISSFQTYTWIELKKCLFPSLRNDFRTSLSVRSF